MSKITWTNEQRKLGDFVLWESNPRQIRQEQAGRLNQSLSEFGQPEMIVIGPNNEVYNGHQRIKTWLTEHGPDFMVDVRVSSRPLTERERQKLTVFLHEGATGEWNWDELANWDIEVEDLVDWGIEEYKMLGKPEIDYDEMWKGMPEFEQDDLGAFKTIKVHFATQKDVEDFAGLVQQIITDKTKYIWYPKLENMNLKEFECQDES